MARRAVGCNVIKKLRRRILSYFFFNCWLVYSDQTVGFPFTCGRTLPTVVFENAALMTYIGPSLPVGIFSTLLPSTSSSSSSHSYADRLFKRPSDVYWIPARNPGKHMCGVTLRSQRLLHVHLPQSCSNPPSFLLFPISSLFLFVFIIFGYKLKFHGALSTWPHLKCQSVPLAHLSRTV